MFQLRQEQLAAIRRKKIGDGLIATFADGPARAYWSDQKRYVIASDSLDNQTRFGFDDQGFIAAVASPLGRLADRQLPGWKGRHPQESRWSRAWSDVHTSWSTQHHYQ